MKTALNFFLIAIGLFVFNGCSTAPIARDPSEYLLTTDRSSTNLLKDIRTKLEENKYKIRKEDPAAGLLVTAPRRFSFEDGGKKVAARQVVQMRQEGGSLKLRIIYDCNYLGDGTTFQPCNRDDAAASTKIGRVEPALLNMIKPALMNHGDKAKQAETVDLDADWGEDAKQ